MDKYSKSLPLPLLLGLALLAQLSLILYSLISKIDILLITISTFTSVLLLQIYLQYFKEKQLSETIINSTPDLVGVYDTQTRIVVFNKACEDLLNIKKETVIGKRYTEAFPTGKDGQGHKDLLRALQGETIHNLDYYSKVSGKYFENFVAPLRNASGKIFGAVAIGHDISEKINMIERLKQSEEKFNTLFTSAPLGISLAEAPTGIIVDVNQLFLQNLGFTREEVIGKTSLELNLIDKQDREKILQEIIEKGSVRNVEVNVRKKTGEKIVVLNSLETVMIDHKKFFISATNDITLRRQAEEKMQQAIEELEKTNQELAAFAYICSHDLQEPLRKIQMFSKRLIEKETFTLSEEGKSQLLRMDNAALHMRRLIDDLLAYSRTNTTEKLFEKTDLNLMLEEIKQLMHETLIATQTSIQSDKLPTLNIIPYQFHQLFTNLIHNSIKFAKPNTLPIIKISSNTVEGITIPSANPQQQYHYLSLSDNGIGFHPRFNEQIFGLFQRLHGKEAYEGSGIGLAIVKKVIENHEGIIRAEGNINEGCTFHIYLPMS